MSKYTTEVRFLCESVTGLDNSKGFNDVNEIITQAAPYIFNFTFPIFDETYRLPLEIKILRHYYTREISEETVGLWKLRLQDKLNMIMPYYNKLYESELLEFNPFYDVNLTREQKKDNSGAENITGNTNTSTATQRSETNNTNSENENTNIGSSKGLTTSSEDGKNSKSATRWDLYSDTPQGGINGITADLDSVGNNTYLTNARKITDTENGTNEANGFVNNEQSSTINEHGKATADSISNGNEQGTINTSNNGTRNTVSTEDYIEQVSGKQGTLSYSKMLEEFRQTFLNIDKMVIDDLSNLFFGLWG